MSFDRKLEIAFNRYNDLVLRLYKSDNRMLRIII